MSDDDTERDELDQLGRQVDHDLEALDDDLDEIDEALDAVRASMEASLEGDHGRAAAILDGCGAVE